MSCSNCYNGCAEVVSDKCVRYTGIDIPALEISNGDTLAYVESKLAEFLVSTLDGTGIKINIPSNIICNLIDGYLPSCGECEGYTVVDLITALIQAACDLQDQVDIINGRINTIEASYNVDCLTGVSGSDGTHDILQAVIDKLCDLEVDLAALALDVDENYVKLADLNSLIQDYLDSISGGTTQQYLKMVPYTVVEYYGPLSNFDGSGAGIASLGWDKIYICNGQAVGSTVTPDKRGRIAVGAIQGVPGGALDPVIAPGGFNPNYALYTTAGSNSVTLTTGQMPSHTHVVTINDPGHRHVFGGDDQVATQGGYTSTGSTFNYDADSTTSGNGKHMFTKDINVTNNLQTTGITVNPVGTSGSNEAHNNIPPVLACYYIMYIP